MRLPTGAVVAGAELSDNVLIGFFDKEVGVIDVGSVAPWVVVDVLRNYSGSGAILTGLDVHDLVPVGFGAFDSIDVRVVEVIGLKRVAVFAVRVDVYVSAMWARPVDRLVIVGLEGLNQVLNRIVEDDVAAICAAWRPVVIFTPEIRARIAVDDHDVRSGHIPRKAWIVIPRGAVAQPEPWIEHIEWKSEEAVSPAAPISEVSGAPSASYQAEVIVTNDFAQRGWVDQAVWRAVEFLLSGYSCCAVPIVVAGVRHLAASRFVGVSSIETLLGDRRSSSGVSAASYRPSPTCIAAASARSAVAGVPA